MKDKFQEQKDILASLKHEISLLHQQVDYLIRHGRELGLLDLDVMMNRTHTIYDQLCSINLGEEADEEPMEVAPEMLNALFGLDDEAKGEETPQPVEKAEEPEETTELGPDYVVVKPDWVPVEPVAEPEPEVQPSAPALFDDTELPEAPLFPEEEDEFDEEEEEPAPEEASEIAPEDLDQIAFDFNLTAEDPEVVEPEPEPEVEPEPEPEVEPEPVVEPEPAASETDYGFIFKMEPVEEKVEPVEEAPAQTYTTGDQIELEIPHFDFPASPDEAPDSDEEPEVEPAPEPEPEEEPEPISFDFNLMAADPDVVETPEPEPVPELEPEPEPEPEPLAPEEPHYAEEPEPVEEPEPFPYEPVVFGNMEDKDDLGFEFETHEAHDTPEPLGEKLHVQRLKSAIGINDKFLLVNELFGGSMEKYNRSIENLDDLPTLNGALIYMNELRIELQWNSNNEAYKKLLELVHRKFED